VSLLEERRCGWCRRELGATAQGTARFCGQRCRQTAFRLRRRSALVERAANPLRLAYADPPYPGLSAKYYRDEPTFAGEVDFRALVSSLQEQHPDGWALSTSARSLRDILPMCPPGARVCPWVKPHPVPAVSYGLHNVWEPLIVVGGRQRRPGMPDALVALPARGGGELPGRKPLAFCAFLFNALGMLPGDTIADLFPGTGVVGRAWHELSSGAGVAGRRPTSAVSLRAGGDVELLRTTP
jgi:hypothetical protein